MRVLYAGTPEIAVPALRLLAEAHTVVGVLTNPDRGSGRGRKPRPSPVKEQAEALSLTLLQPQRLDAAARQAVAALEPELLVCVAYGKIFGPKFLSLFPAGGINLHPSLLPKYRGPAPIPAAILAGEEKTGITVQRLALEMDAGAILLQLERPLEGRERAGELTEWAGEEGARMIVEVVDAIEAGEAREVPQEESQASYCSFLTKEESWIDWRESAERIDRMIRAYTPWPLARTRWEGEQLIIHAGAPAPEPLHREVLERFTEERGAPEAVPGRVLGVDKDFGILIQTGGGALGVTRLQAPARRPMAWDAFINGNPELMSALLGASKESERK
ncbi:MAG: methionyl-tRNA formyltransferase [Alkalispirochaetaceae bacterium]